MVTLTVGLGEFCGGDGDGGSRPERGALMAPPLQWLASGAAAQVLRRSSRPSSE